MYLRIKPKASKKFVLNDRDKKVVEMFSKGFTAKRIGELGGVSRRTVEAVVGRLMVQYKCASTTHLVATFLRKKIIK